MVVLDENIVLDKLNKLIDIEVKDLLHYAAVPSCVKAKNGYEYEYKQQKQRVTLLIEAKNYILFSYFFPDRSAN